MNRVWTVLILSSVLCTFPCHAADAKQSIRALLKKNRPSEALDFALENVDRYSSDPEYLFLVGRSYQELKLNLEALQFYSEAVALDRDNYKLYINRGLVYGALKNLRASMVDLKRAIELRPTSKEAHLNLGFTYAAQNDTKRAITSFTKAIQLDPSFAEAYRNRGITRHYLGQKSQACSDWRKSLQIKKDEVSSWIQKYCN